MMTSIHMPYCIICKEIVDNRYILRACDSRLKNVVDGNVCRHCYNKLIESKHGTGFFKLSKLAAWVKRNRDTMRHL